MPGMRTIALPEDVLLVIFNDIVTARNEYKAEWSYIFQLLAVCSEWRNMLLPYAYNKLFFTMDMFASYPEECNSVAEFKDTTTSLDILTNVDLYPVNYTAMARRLDITISYTHSPFAALKAIVNALKSKAAAWQGITLLNIDIYYKVWNGDDQKLFMANVPVAWHAAEELKKVLPNVNCIKFMGSDVCANMSLVSSNLIESFCSQLHGLEYGMPLLLTVPKVFSQLTSLCLNSNALFSKKVPHICVDMLQSLVLHRVPSNFGLSRFNAVATAGQHLKFSSLKRLVVEYTGLNSDKLESVLPSSAASMHFPKLKELSLKNCPLGCDVLRLGIFPEQLDKCSISGKMDTLTHLGTSSILQYNVLNIDILLTRGVSRTDLTSGLNRLFAKVHVQKSLQLDCGTYHNAVEINWLNCTNLTNFSCTASVSTESVFQLLSHISTLKTLRLSSILVSGTSLLENEPDIAEHACTRLQPFAARVKHLDLYRFGGCNRSKAVVKNMVLRLPTLQELLVSPDFQPNINQFVALFLALYSHLRGLESGDY